MVFGCPVPRGVPRVGTFVRTVFTSAGCILLSTTSEPVGANTLEGRSARTCAAPGACTASGGNDRSASLRASPGCEGHPGRYVASDALKHQAAKDHHSAT